MSATSTSVWGCKPYARDEAGFSQRQTIIIIIIIIIIKTYRSPYAGMNTRRHMGLHAF
jgi:hypothetical protein